MVNPGVPATVRRTAFVSPGRQSWGNCRRVIESGRTAPGLCRPTDSFYGLVSQVPLTDQIEASVHSLRRFQIWPASALGGGVNYYTGSGR